MQVSHTSAGTAALLGVNQATGGNNNAGSASDANARNAVNKPQPGDAAQRRRANDKSNSDGAPPSASNKFLDFLKKNHLTDQELQKAPPAERAALKNAGEANPNADAQPTLASYRAQHAVLNAAFATTVIANSVA